MNNINICLCTVCDCKTLELKKKYKLLQEEFDKLQIKFDELQENFENFEKCEMCGSPDQNMNGCSKCFVTLCTNCYEIIFNYDDEFNNEHPIKKNFDRVTIKNKYKELLNKYNYKCGNCECGYLCDDVCDYYLCEHCRNY
jgi:hypothetical protein